MRSSRTTVQLVSIFAKRPALAGLFLHHRFVGQKADTWPRTGIPEYEGTIAVEVKRRRLTDTLHLVFSVGIRMIRGSASQFSSA